jgi:hypothetical protein
MIGLQPASPVTNGGHLRLQSVAGIVEYSSGHDPFSLSVPGVQDRRFGGGANATLGYFLAGERSLVSWGFTSSYVQRMHSAELNAWTNTMSLGWTRRLSPRLAMTLSGSGALGSATDLLFMPSSSMQLAKAAGTPEELASVVLTGTSTNPVLSSLATASSSVDPQTLSLLYGRTALTVDGQVILDYTHTPRLSFRWRAGGNRTQPWRVSSDPIASQQIISQSISGYFEMGMKYAMSPRTQLGVELSTQRAHSRINDGYTSSAMLYLGRTMTRRWFLALYGGAGAVTPVRSPQVSISAHRGANYQAAGSIGYRNLSQTVLFSASRLVSDRYGLDADATTGGGISWVWQRAGSAWFLGAELGYHRLSGAANMSTGSRHNLESRTVTPTIGRKITASTVAQLQYLFSNFSTPIATARGSDKYQHAARLSVMWVPGATSR